MIDNTPLQSADHMSSHNGLKALVIGLGILIIIGLTVLIGTILWRVSQSAATSEATSELSITLPDGALIEDSDADGDQLVLHLVFPNNPARQEILVINLVSGQIKSRIDVKREQ
jgi:hypothetical protein